MAVTYAGYDLAEWGGVVTDPPTTEGVIELHVSRELRVYLMRETPAHSMRDARTHVAPPVVRRYRAQGRRGGDNA